MTHPTIILLGGTYGVGKTTVAHQLGIEMGILQRVAVAGITATIKTLIPDEDIVRHWYRYDSDNPDDVRIKLLRESRLIGQVIHSIVDSAIKSGENYIIDGVQLLPEFLPLEWVTLVILRVSDAAEHRRRYEQPTVTRARHLTSISFEQAQLVEQLILKESSPWNTAVLDNISPPSDTARTIRDMIEQRNLYGTVTLRSNRDE